MKAFSLTLGYQSVWSRSSVDVIQCQKDRFQRAEQTRADYMFQKPTVSKQFKPGEAIIHLSHLAYK